MFLWLLSFQMPIYMSRIQSAPFTWVFHRCYQVKFQKMKLLHHSLLPTQRMSVLPFLFLFRFFFFLMWTIFKVFYWICYNIVSVLYFGFWPQGMWNLSSPARDGNQAPSLEGKVLTPGPPGKSPFTHFNGISGRWSAFHLEPASCDHYSSLLHVVSQ